MSLLIKKVLQKIKELDGKIEDSGWNDLTLLDNWISYSGQNPPQYRKKNGIVNNLYYTVRIISGSSGSIGHLQITKAGILLGAIGMGSNDWVALDGISFPVE